MPSSDLLPPEVTVTEHASLEALTALEDHWLKLWKRSGQTPFQSPMWLIPWARHFTGTNLQVVIFRTGTELVAVAPFYRWSNEGETKLFLLGNGISDYLDMCCEPQQAPRASNQLAQWLCDQPRIDAVELNQLRPNSPLVHLALPGTSVQPGPPSPVLHLHGRDLTSSIPPRQMEKLRYYRRRADKLGRWRVDLASSPQCREGMLELFRLHALRWAERGESGVVQDPHVQSFHIQAAQAMAEAGCLRLHRLILQDKIIGVLYALADARVTYFYLSGFDPAFESISPGMLLLGAAIQQALDEAHEAFDFLRGCEKYKYAWGAEDRQTCRLAGSLGRSPSVSEAVPPSGFLRRTPAQALHSVHPA